MLGLPINTIYKIENQRKDLIVKARDELDMRLRVIEGLVVPTTFTVIDPLELCESRAAARVEALDYYKMDLVRIEANIYSMYLKADTGLSSLIQDTPDISSWEWKGPQ
jgi:hypothetical protein